jgi:hypothetical protein
MIGQEHTQNEQLLYWQLGRLGVHVAKSMKYTYTEYIYLDIYMPRRLALD